MSNHGAFADSLLATQPVCPPGLRAWNQSDPERRFAVYRNNVMVSLIDALADTYPVSQAMVGEEFFRAAAGVFARAHPPRSPIMAHYGEEFPDFLGTLPAAAGLPYLADLARLEMLQVQAYHAADATSLPPAAIAPLLAAPDRLPAARFTLQPSLRILASPHAVVSLWAAHQSEDIDAALAAVDTALPESALIVRSGLEVETYRIAAGTASFIQSLRDACRFDAAVKRALDADPAFDLTDALSLLLRSGALTGVVQ